MLHISICDDEIVAVEKMRKIVGKVLEQEQLLANVGTFENGEEFLNQYIIRDDELVMGHLIVEEQVKRLGGMVEYYEDEMFCAHIYLPM